ncbi:hypothetical protein KKC32_01585 [Patescibacteria group bacterium]|nr:hypothetical protein [Patescibacteria group bacterium]
MLIITNNRFDLQSTVDVLNHDKLLPDLLEAIEDYIINSKVEAVINGVRTHVMHVSGFAQTHHLNLAKYLNSHVLHGYSARANMAKGHFANFPLLHYWLEIENMILDIAIRQFIGKPIDFPELMIPLLERHCFISDNEQNFIYRQYRKIR